MGAPKKMTRRVKLSVYLDGEQHEQLKALAGANVGGYIRELVSRALVVLQRGDDLDRTIVPRPSAEADDAVGTPTSVIYARPSRLPEGVVKGSAVSRPVCVACGHPRHKHSGFKSSCQEDRCACPGFEEAV